MCARTGHKLETISSAALGIDKHGVELAMNNVIHNLRSVTFGAVTWSDNERLWNENVQVSEPRKSCLSQTDTASKKIVLVITLDAPGQKGMENVAIY